MAYVASELFSIFARTPDCNPLSTAESAKMALVNVDLPSPKSLRGGWAALSAICAAKGWSDLAYATDSQWYYHDGGGNWACLRFQDQGRAVLVGHDHEYSRTYFGPAADYFGEEETNLLLDAPDWWGRDLDPKLFGEWIGFIYGWNGEQWLRAEYTKDDGFHQVGLLRDCTATDGLSAFAKGAPGLKGARPEESKLELLVMADTDITAEQMNAIVPGWDIDAGLQAAQRFQAVQL